MSDLVVKLPEETEKQIYQLFVSLGMQALEEVQKASYKRYLTQTELMRMMRCNLEVIKEWQAQGLPYFRKGNSIMYDLEDVHQFINDKLKQ